MDLSFTPEQHAVRDLARQIFDGMCTEDRLREIEAGGERHDPALWTELARAGLLGLSIPEADGGSGGGIIELCLLLEEAGRAAAPVPLWGALVTGSLPVARFGSGEQRAQLLAPYPLGGAPVVAALDEANRIAIDDGGATGTLTLVPAAAMAAAIIVAAADGVFVIDPAGAVLERQNEPIGSPLYRVTLEGARAEQLAGLDVVPWVREHALVGLCALQTGICDRAVRLTAEYLSGREQFDKPLGSFQAVQQRIADAYINLETVRWTMWRAAFLLAQGRPAAEETAVAKHFASAAGARALEAAQHLHGGMGVDTDYPLHRYRLLAHQVELTLGGSWPHLAALGEMIAR